MTVSKHFPFLCTGAFALLYLCLPYRIWNGNVLLENRECIFVFAGLSPFFLLYHVVNRKTSVKVVDILLAMFGLYILVFSRRPVSIEFICEILGLSTFYLYAKTVPLKDIGLLLWVVPIACLFQFFYSIAAFTQPWETLFHVKGIFYNTGIWGCFVALSILVASCLLAQHKSWMVKIILSVILAVLCVALYCSYSRTAWISVFVGEVILLFAVFRNRISQKSIQIMGGVGVVAFGLVLAGLYGIKKESADGRLLIWRVSSEMIQRAPLMGHGLNGFEAQYMDHQADYFRNHPDSPYAMLADDVFSPFNEYLKIGIEWGLVGLLLVAGILYLVWFKRRPEEASERPAVIMAQVVLVGLLVQAFFSYPFSYFSFKILLVFVVGILSARAPSIAMHRGDARCLNCDLSDSYDSFDSSVSAEPCQPHHINQINHTKITVQTKKRNLILSTVGILILLALLAVPTFRHITHLNQWNRAIHQGYRDSRGALEMLDALYPAFNTSADFLYMYGVSLYNAQRFESALVVLQQSQHYKSSYRATLQLGMCYEKLNNIPQAMEEWREASNMIPSRFAPPYLMAKTLYETGDTENARKIHTELLNKKKKIDSLPVTIMLQEINELSQTYENTCK
jgi:O-antigen ligase